MTKAELLKIIRAHCLDCCCGDPAQVRDCGIPSCALYTYRFGKDESPKVLSPAQLARMEKMRLCKEKKRAEMKKREG